MRGRAVYPCHCCGVSDRSAWGPADEQLPLEKQALVPVLWMKRVMFRTEGRLPSRGTELGRGRDELSESGC